VSALSLRLLCGRSAHGASAARTGCPLLIYVRRLVYPRAAVALEAHIGSRTRGLRTAVAPGTLCNEDDRQVMVTAVEAVTTLPQF
jgi:hypothetical protein